jgi:glycosyltransferase involved in cell wall biosynthesis
MKAEDILISICCTTFNHEKYIGQCLDGFVMQKTTFAFEILVHEDASTDSTAAIIKEYELNYPHIFKCVYQHDNQFLKQNTLINILFKMAKGKYIALCEGDDYWTDPYKLQKQVDFLEANGNYVACFHKVKILETSGSLVDDYITKVPNNHETIEDLAQSGNYIHTPSVVFRNIIKIFPDEFFISSVGDYFIYMLLAEHGKFKYLTDSMATYRNGVGNHSSLSQADKTINFNITLFLIWHVYIKKNNIISNILFGRIKDKLTQILNNNVLIDRLIKIDKNKVELALSLIKQLEYSHQLEIVLTQKNAVNDFLKSASSFYLFKIILYRLGVKNYFKKLIE